MFSVDPLLTPAQVLLILQTSARAFPDGSTCNTSLCGRGMLDAGAALSLTQHEYTLTTGVIGDGSINRDKPGPYHYGDVVELTPVPDPGWKFSA